MQLSVIVRFHEGANINLLTRALYCLLDETVLEHEVVVMVQFVNDATLHEVEALCARLFDRIPCRVTGVRVAAGVDRRGQLLAEGVALAQGRYITFLDYDDMLFLGGAATAMRICDADQADLAIAQCLIAYIEGIFPRDYVVTKEKFVTQVPQNPLYMLHTNFAPICACVVSRAFLTRTGITFPSEAALLEDYEFLLRAVATGRTTLRPLSEGVLAGQYNFNIDAGGTALRLYLDEEIQQQETQRWDAARERIRKTVLPALSVNLDLLTLKELMLMGNDSRPPAVLDIPAFIKRVRDGRAKA